MSSKEIHVDFMEIFRKEYPSYTTVKKWAAEFRMRIQDETWVRLFDPESKKQSMQWKHPGSPLLRNLRDFFSGEGDGLYLLG